MRRRGRDRAEGKETGTDFIDILKASRGWLPRQALAGLRLLRCWGSSRSAQGCWGLVEARDAQHGNGPQKQSGLWVVGCLLEGWAKSPRQDEAAAVVRLVWPAGCRAVRVAWLPTGPPSISRKERQGARQGARQGRLGPATGGLQGQIWISKVAIRTPGVG